MKSLFVITAVVILSLFFMGFNQSMSQNPTPNDFKSTCKVLAYLSGEAIKNRDNSSLILYYNMYKSMKEKQLIDTTYDKSFSEILNYHGYDSGTRCFSMHKSAYKPTISTRQTGSTGQIGGGGGYVNRKINENTFFHLIERDMIESDINNLLFLLDVKNDQVNIDNLSNLNLGDLEITIDRLRRMKISDLELIDDLNFDKNIYRFNEFDRLIRN
jgi:hypothetical protein